jgi:hypothetical protein
VPAATLRPALGPLRQRDSRLWPLGYLYTNATIDGSTAFSSEDFGDALPPGKYEARLMRDDAYVELAIAKFTVTE